MDTESWNWFLRTMVKSALLGIPAVVILLLWSRRSIASKLIYRISWASPIIYLLWLATVASMFFLDNSPRYRPLIPASLPADVFVFAPFLLAIGSLFTCLISLAAHAGERVPPFIANGLMLVLWRSVVVAPN